MVANTLPWRDEYLAEHFQRIGEFLQRYQPLWRPQAFQEPHLAWQQQLPELAQMLRGLDYARAEQLAEDDRALALCLNPFIADAAAIYASCEIPSLAAGNISLQQTEAHAVPGRKWQQVNAFAACIPVNSSPLLEWCAGKAHLGRLLARVQRRSVTALEWSAELVAAGTVLARREHLPVHLHCVDVLAPDGAAFVRREHDVIALHACGQLHVQLLHTCVSQRPRALTLAPCCYHLGVADRYKPLSRLANAADLQLELTDLHTAVRDSVTSPQRIQQQRKTLQAWRLGFDIWQREVRGVDGYLPTPSRSFSVLKNGFPAFCRELAVLHDLEVPAALRYEHYEQAGWRRLREIACLDLPRILFRRPLELWLILDRALFLREHSYSVEIGTFCERRLTPRNVALRAQRI